MTLWLPPQAAGPPTTWSWGAGAARGRPVTGKLAEPPASAWPLPARRAWFSSRSSCKHRRKPSRSSGAAGVWQDGEPVAASAGTKEPAAEPCNDEATTGVSDIVTDGGGGRAVREGLWCCFRMVAAEGVDATKGPVGPTNTWATGATAGCEGAAASGATRATEYVTNRGASPGIATLPDLCGVACAAGKPAGTEVTNLLGDKGRPWPATEELCASTQFAGSSPKLRAGWSTCCATPGRAPTSSPTG
mmetsp:Transcript_92625/g.207392  ORF Transcript_92625/g.207392 Transcript_92625/m.207392 type:complete len:246 (-) Transcript_92625:480-1217(-)